MTKKEVEALKKGDIIRFGTSNTDYEVISVFSGNSIAYQQQYIVCHAISGISDKPSCKVGERIYTRLYGDLPWDWRVLNGHTAKRSPKRVKVKKLR